MKELEAAPEPLLRELLSFLSLLKGKKTPVGIETAIASETVLGKDWLKPEEDEAWKDL